jgi:hypothetical protein
MKYRLLIITLVIILISVSPTLAAWTTATYTPQPTNSGAFGPETIAGGESMGIVFQPNIDGTAVFNVTIVNAGGGITRARLCNLIDCSDTTWDTATFSGATAGFTNNISFDKDDVVFILVDNSGASYNSYYGNAGTFPQNFTIINYTSGMYKEVNHSTVWQDILSVTFGNGSDPAPPPPANATIEFFSQQPADINSATPFIYDFVNITYNYTNTSQITPAYLLNYSTVSHHFDCIHYDNGTCELENNSFTTKTFFGNVTTGESALISFNLTENEIFPINENFETLEYDGELNNVSLTGSNHYLSNGFLNLTAPDDDNLTVIYEVPLLTTGIAVIYYYNDSYDFSSSPATNSNVAVACTLSNVPTYNHTHDNGIGHNLCYTLFTNGEIGGVGVGGGGFIIRRLTGVVNVTLINVSVRENSTRLSTNNGNTWTEQNTTASHIHMFSGEDYLIYQALGNMSGTPTNSSFRNDTFEVAITPPTPPEILNPSVEFQEVIRQINITWNNSFPTTLLANISYYNVTLLNDDFSINRTIIDNNGLNLSYWWLVYPENLSLGEYYFQVTAVDTNNLTADSFASINITRDAELNVSVVDIHNNSIFIASNLTINWSGNSQSNETLTGNISLDVVRGVEYEFYVDADGYAFRIINHTVSDTAYDNVTLELYPTNSITFNIFNALTLAALNGTNVTIDMEAGVVTYNFTTDTGYLFVENITEGFYTIIFSAENFSTSTYFLTMTNRTTQTLNAYLTPDAVDIGVYVKDGAEEPVVGALFTLQRPINGSYVTVGQGIADVIGYILFELQEGALHLGTISAEGFATRQFNFTPYFANQPYTFKLSPNTTTIFYDFNNYIVYSYTPEDNDLETITYNFTFTTTSKTGGVGSNSILWTAMNCNGSISNVSGSPSGTTITQEVDLSGTATLTCEYWFRVDGFEPVYFTNVYNTFNYTGGNYTLPTALDRAGDDIDSHAWNGLLALLITFAFAFLAFEVSKGDQAVTTIAAFGTQLYFAIIGWLPLVMVSITVFIAALLFFNERSGY